MSSAHAAVPQPPEPIAFETMREAAAQAARTGRRVMEVLEEVSGLSRDDYLACLANSFGYGVFRMEDLHALTPAFEVISLPEAMARECVAGRDTAGRLCVVIGNPLDGVLKSWLEERIPQQFTWGVAHSSDLAAGLAQLEASARAVDSFISQDLATEKEKPEAEDISFQNIAADESPIVKFVNSTLYDALKAGASDIHLETSPGGLAFKYRLDGVLVSAGSLPGIGAADQVISRIKVMAELDIAERRVPQDGRFKASINRRGIDFRVSVMPSVFGEDAVIRILDKQALVDQSLELRLDSLGFDADTIGALRKLAREPYGMLLVTGPTGSGKTTTLYAVITEINSGQDKIITIEDPVEYQLQGVLQIPVNERKGLTFARGLRSILRHDPDKILVGEIRDPETAEIAVQAALTGHLVFTTVHANNVFDVIGRFTHMNVDPYSFVSALNGIVAQRLVRLVCPRCASGFRPPETLLVESGLEGVDLSPFEFCVGKGCGHCRGTGYKGRKAVGEVLWLGDEMRELIVARAPIRQMRETAARRGTRFLRDRALDLVRCGETSLQEINRVTLVG
jgi:general secretion pathway protein E